MITSPKEMIKAEEKSLVKQLQVLLEKQIVLLNQGESTGRNFESLTSQTDELVNKITRYGISDKQDNIEKKKNLKKLYSQLLLELTAQKDETMRQLNRIRMGKKTLGIYRSTIV